MQNIAVIFGGESPEHDVSILTGLHLAQHITADYRVTLIYWTKDNRFLYGSRNIDYYINGKAAKAKPFRAWHRLACVINCCHGGVGENGALSALLSIYHVPLTSCAPSVAYRLQSKIETRQMLTLAGFTQPRFQVVTNLDLDRIQLPLPLIIKPEMLGSSIGINVAHNKEELFEAVKLALQMGERAIVEEYIADMCEVNVAVMRERGQIITSGLEMIHSQNFFSFQEKYGNPNSGFIKKSGVDPDAAFLGAVANKIKTLAVQAYQLFGATGIVRADFMVKGDKVILNEINTVPGFMAYHLWQKVNLPYGVVIDTLIKETLAKAQNDHYITTFNSDVLTKNRQLVLEH